MPTTSAVPFAFQGTLATLARGTRSTTIAMIGDSTGDGLLVGAGTQVDEWAQVFTKRLAADYPGYSLLERRWNDANQGYDMPITWQLGTSNGSGPRGCLFTAATPGSMQYQASTITGDIDIRVQINPSSWTPASDRCVCSKWEPAGNQRSFYFLLKNTGKLALNWSADGTTNVGEKVSTVLVNTATGWVNGAPFWVRATLAVASGNVLFYTSPDGVTWTQLGTTVASAATSIFNGTAPYQMGAFGTGLSSPFDGVIHWIDIRSGLASQTSVVAPLPDDWDWYSGASDTVISLVGAPVIMFLNGSQSGQNVAYFDNSTRRPVLHQPHGQGVLIINDSHNDGLQSRQQWMTNYSTMVTNIKTLLPNVPIVLIGQNPVFLGGTFSISTQGSQLRAARAALIGQYAAAQAGVYYFDVNPYFEGNNFTVDSLHPTSGRFSGSEIWGLAFYSQVVR